MRFNKRITGLTVLVLGSLLFMAWLAGLLHFGKIAPGVVPIKGAPAPGQILVVQETAIPQELEVLGTVISKSLAQVSVQVPGRVAKIWVEAGSRVKPGEPLVSLAAAEYQARLSQAQAQLNQAAADFKRYQFLLKEGAVSPQEFGAMEARYQTAQAQVAEAATMKGYTVVKAPEAGVVAERKTAVGDLAQPGQVLVTLYNPALLQIEGEVNDSYREQVKLGDTARAFVPAVQFQADLPLTEIFPISAAGSRTFKVRTKMLSDPRLTPGMFARLKLPLGPGRGLLIPREAVQTVGQLTMVKVMKDQTSELRQVKLGRQVGEQVEVLAGVQAGDRIILTQE
ncbi:MAG: efflux RND transporter periplasmic adaptor subunit [Deltaproteobacteria bacterium]|nr:efflux RND transporter periplasmic adaptor subunit [Deltaproteobacteria bacterium]